MLAAVMVAACLASRASAEGSAMAGETCDSSDDCYNGVKCLPEGGGGRCCEFTKQSFDDAQFSGGMNDDGCVTASCTLSDN